MYSLELKKDYIELKKDLSNCDFYLYVEKICLQNSVIY